MGLFDILFGKRNKKTKNEIKNKPEPQTNSFKTNQVSKKGDVSVLKPIVDDTFVEKISKKFIAFDVETTGFVPCRDKIVEVGAVVFENQEETKSFQMLVNPQMSIPEEVINVHHITNEMVKDSLTEKEMCNELCKFLGDALSEGTVICAHNAKFDMSFLSETFKRNGVDAKICYVDTLELSQQLVKNLKNYKQDTVAKHFNIKNENEHRAVTDARTCGQILNKLLDIRSEELKLVKDKVEKNTPRSDELDICRYIQDMIVSRGGNIDYLRFARRSSGYIAVSYLYTILKFKVGKKRYVILDKEAAKNLSIKTSPCTKTEGIENVRYEFDTTADLDIISDHIYKQFDKTQKSANEYMGRSERNFSEAMNCLKPLIKLS